MKDLRWGDCPSGPSATTGVFIRERMQEGQSERRGFDDEGQMGEGEGARGRGSEGEGWE